MPMTTRTAYKEIVAGILGFLTAYIATYSLFDYSHGAGHVFPVAIGLAVIVQLVSVILTGKMP